MPTIQAPDRQQLTFMNTLDDLVGLDHPVRAPDALVDHIIGADPAFFNHLAPQTSAGRRGYPAGALIKLLLYGYLHGISSSRKLAAEAGRNIEVIWLLSALAPSYNLIADYRKDYHDQLACINAAVVRFLADGGWIDGERVASMGPNSRPTPAGTCPTSRPLRGAWPRRTNSWRTGWSGWPSTMPSKTPSRRWLRPVRRLRAPSRNLWNK